MFWFIFVLGLNFPSANCDRRKIEVMDGHGYSLAIKRLQCINSSIVTVDTCKIKLKRGIAGEVNVGLTFLKKVHIVLLRAHVLRKTSANYYIPTVLDATFNVCDVTHNELAMGTLKTFLTMFIPEAMELIKPLIHQCPYEGIHKIDNFTIKRMTVPNMLQTGDAKLMGTVMDKNKMVLFELQLYVYIKSPSLMQIN